jgi:hypothetical protein
MWATWLIFKKTAKSKQLPVGQIFAQSGHTAVEENFIWK